MKATAGIVQASPGRGRTFGMTLRIWSISCSKSMCSSLSASSSTRCLSVRREKPCSCRTPQLPPGISLQAAGVAAARLGVGQVVHDAARRADNNVRALAQRNCLRAAQVAAALGKL